MHRFQLFLSPLPVAALLLFLPGCRKEQAAKSSPVQKVIVVQPSEQSVQRYEEFTGRIAPVETVDIKARVTGFLKSVHFKEGAEVQKDALLYTIDRREYQAIRDAAAASYDQANWRLKQAQNDVERAKQLARTSAIPAQELERSSTTLAQFEAALRLAKADLDKADLNLSFTEIKAPICGKISRTQITEGNLVENGNTLTTIVQQDPLYVYFEAPERALQNWNPDEDLELSIGLSEEKEYPHAARLDFADNQLNASTGTLRLRAVLDNPKRILRPGYFARVHVAFGVPEKTLMIPDRAVGIDQGERFVYVVSADNKLQFRRIETGQVYDGKRAIRQGLKAGENVVSEGITMLKPGMQVTMIVPDAPAATVASEPSPKPQS